MTHHTLTVGGFREKVGAAVRLVEANGRTIIFTRTREGAVELAEALTGQGVDAVDLHGNLSQKVRERNLHRFSSGAARAVVATDVAARGIHVDAVDMVIHFDAASDAKAYLHRSGRTARAGRDGAVVTITTPKFLQQVVRLQQHAGVEVLHHDIQTAPDHLSAAALAKHGSPAPKSSSSPSSYDRKKSGGFKSGGYKGSNAKSGYKSGGGYKGGQKTSENSSGHGPRKAGAPSYGKGKAYAGKRATAGR
jgi:superfamily II DNA/RNA helicase